jgi:Icc-related predicted phosphoesterase
VRVHVVSDVHGAYDALARSGDGADAVVCLGDLIHFIDYDDFSGIMTDLFGVAATRRLVELRTARRFDEAREWSRTLWSGVAEDRAVVLERAVRAQYERTFAVLPEPAYLTYGNVDLPHLMGEYLRPGHTLLDGQVVEIAGLRFGFVGGGLQTPMRTPTELPDDVYAAKVEALGAVDVLCCHIPPDLPWLLYDTRARRFERGSTAVLAAVQATQPRWCLFGHVHNPYVGRLTIGRTECVNVGHFRGTGTPFALDL